MQPNQDQVGLQRDDALDVEPLGVADSRHRLCVLRIVAGVDRADQRSAGAHRIDQLGEVGRDRDDALRRTRDVDLPAGQEKFIELNAELSRTMPAITSRTDPPPDADEWKDVSDKLHLLER